MLTCLLRPIRKCSRETVSSETSFGGSQVVDFCKSCFSDEREASLGSIVRQQGSRGLISGQIWEAKYHSNSTGILWKLQQISLIYLLEAIWFLIWLAVGLRPTPYMERTCKRNLQLIRKRINISHQEHQSLLEMKLISERKTFHNTAESSRKL